MTDKNKKAPPVDLATQQQLEGIREIAEGCGIFRDPQACFEERITPDLKPLVTEEHRKLLRDTAERHRPLTSNPPRR